MKILVLGGTQFLGSHLVRAALDRGHEVTLFNRGVTNAGLFAGEAETIVGDRDGNLTGIKGRQFDACIDPSGYVPRLVGASCELLKDVVDHYTFVSSISVYPRFTKDMDESSAVATLDDPDTEEIEKHYGGLKVLCEQKAEEIMPGRVLQVRSGLIVGPSDPTDRFTYWPFVMKDGGPFIAPIDEDYPVQVIDGRDQANWIIDSIAANLTGVFHVTGHQQRFADVISAAQEAFGVTAEPRWADEAFLLENKVTPWVDLPMWLPEQAKAMVQVSVEKASQHGLTTRPLADTMVDLLAWHPGDRDSLQVGLTRAREQELLSLLEGKQ